MGCGSSAFSIWCVGDCLRFYNDSPDTLLSIISGFHYHMQASVRYNGSSPNTFPVTHGVKQGCVLAPTLFANYASSLSIHFRCFLHSRSSGKLFNLSRFRAHCKTRWVFIGQLLYAHDAAFVAHSIADAQVLCNSFAAACTDFGMKISLSKSVVLVQGAPDP